MSKNATLLICVCDYFFINFFSSGFPFFWLILLFFLFVFFTFYWHQEIESYIWGKIYPQLWFVELYLSKTNLCSSWFFFFSGASNSLFVIEIDWSCLFFCVRPKEHLTWPPQCLDAREKVFTMPTAKSIWALSFRNKAASHLLIGWL